MKFPTPVDYLKKLFSKPQKSKTIFIVEDNPAYAKTMEVFLKSRFPDIKEISIFPVAEVCMMQLHRNPTAILMDYFLDTKYQDAETGLEAIKEILGQKPATNIILLSAQDGNDTVHHAVNKYGFNFVKKDEHAFKKVEQFIRIYW